MDDFPPDDGYADYNDGRDDFTAVPFDGRDYPGDNSVDEAREYVRETLRRDIRRGCPCCGRDVYLYKRPLNATMARTIIKLWRAGGEEDFVHVPGLSGDTHEGSQLSWWGLAVSSLERRSDGGKRGEWKLTRYGVDFVLDDASIPRYARTFDAHCFWLEGEPRTIIDCLKDPFHYRRLMGFEGDDE